MTRFLYKARDRFGVATSGFIEASHTKDVVAILEDKKLIPVEVSQEEPPSITLDKFFERFERKVKPDDLLIFCQQISSLLNSGVTLLESLTAVNEVVKSGKLRTTIKLIRKDIEAGSSFSQSLEKYPDIFPDFLVNMIKAGEKAGILGKIMERTIKILEKDLDNQKKIKSAVRYPMFVLFALSIAFFVVITLIIPKFTVIYASFKVDLPLPTKILIGINMVIRQFWLLIIVVIGAIYYAFRKVLEGPAGKLQFDRFILSIPVSGMLITKIILSRFSRIFSAMLSSGITVVEALTISSRTSDNEVFKRVILNLRDEVVKGESLAGAMRGSNMFPAVAMQMVAVGEKAGNIEEMLDHVADYFEKETDYMTENLSSMIEPILVLFLGMLVLLLALGVYLPIWNMMQLFRT